MSGTRTRVSKESLQSLLRQHNEKFPDKYLHFKAGSNWVRLHTTENDFSKTFRGFLKAFNYLKNRVYYNKKGKSPNLGYKNNKNALKR